MIHQYCQNGYPIVLDINSGSVHVTDPVVYDMVALYQSHRKEEIVAEMLRKYRDRADVTKAELEIALADIDALIQKGKLFSGEENLPSVEELKEKTETSPILKAMCLHVAHTCNLTCDYCFARQGQFSGERALMSFEVGKQALDFLVAHSGNHRNLEVDFFGGEPLLNWQVVKDLVSYGRGLEARHQKHFRFTLTTNGVLLDDEVIDFCNQEMQNVVLSLDGRKKVHDRLRRLGNGNGSYELIVPKFQNFVRRRGKKSYYIRGTFTQFNKDFTEDIQHMLDLGFRALSMEPVVCDPQDPYALRKEDLPQLVLEYEKLAEMMLRQEEKGDPFSFYHYNLDLRHGPCIHKRIKGCGCGTEYFAVTPWGSLYPCHQFVGDAPYEVGDVWQGINRPEQLTEFSHCTVYENPDCRNCWAKFYCSGGCSANAYHATGSVRGIYGFGCDLFRKRMESAIMLAAARGDRKK